MSLRPIWERVKPSDHELRAKEFFKEFAQKKAHSIKSGDRSVVFVHFTNRSGSNHVCECLASTGYFYDGGEALNHDVLVPRCKKAGLSSLQEYINFLIDRVGPKEKGLLIKVGVQQLMWVFRSVEFESAITDRMVISVERNDLLAQAVSFSIADQTKRWTSEQLGGDVIPVYDGQDILNRIVGISNQMAWFKEFCASMGINPIFIKYEDFVKNRDAQIAKIGKAFDLPLRLDYAKLKLQKQANALNEEFISRFRAEMQSKFFGQ